MSGAKSQVMKTRQANAKGMLPLVSTIIVSHNRIQKLKRLIHSLESASYQNVEVIVVDDGSTDGTEHIVRNEFPRVRLIRNSTPHLLSYSRNRGMLLADGDYLLVIDDDNEVATDAIGTMVSTMQGYPHIGMLGGLTFYLAHPDLIWCAGVRRNMVTMTSLYVGYNQENKQQFGSLERRHDFPNAFMLRKKTVEEVGLFDERLFPSHLAEADYGQRVRNLGWDVVLQPRAYFYHDIIKSKPVLSFQRYLNRPWTAYEWERNRIFLRRKLSTKLAYLGFLVLLEPMYLFAFALVVLTSTASFRSKLQSLGWVTAGIADALMGNDIPRKVMV
jgi:GT2 family glycosyltransferase